MIKHILIAIVLVLVCINPAAAKDYYVDKISGSDLNNGITPTHAWKSLAKVNKSSFLPGDNIYLKRGSVWEEELIVPTSGTQEAPITFGAYGTGNRPLIKSSNRFNDWKLSIRNGSVKIWEGRIAGTHNLWDAAVGGVRLNRYHGYKVPNSELSAPDNVVEMKNSYYFAPLNRRKFFIRDDSGKPAAVDIGVRKYGIYIREKKYITIDNIDVMGPSGCENNRCRSYFDGELGFFLITVEASDYITIKNSLTSAGSIGGIIFVNGSSNGLISNVISHGHQTTGIYFWKAGEGNKIVKSEVYNCGNNINDYGDIGSIGAFKTPHLSVEDCHVHDNGHAGVRAIDAAISFVHSPFGSITRCNVENSGGTGIQFAANSDYGVASFNVINRWGLCGAAKVPNEGIRIGGGATGSTAKNCKVYNNLFINGGTTPGHYGALRIVNQNSEGLEVKNNIFYNNSGVYDVMAESPNGFMGWIFSNNLYYRTDGNAIYWNGKIYDYRHIIGNYKGYYSFEKRQDKNSIAGDPLLNSDKKGLESGSPCIDSGADVGILKDYHGNPVPKGRAVDIGPFEYGY